MTIASEASDQTTQLGTALRQGLNNLSRDQTITFTQYTKYVFAQDGYVFWVKTANTVVVKGSLHYGTDRSQEEDQTIGINSVIFTAEQEITEFNTTDTTVLWIAEFATEGGSILIAFSSRGAYYEQADIWHYTGFAVYPALQSQLVAATSDLPVGPIVSNSLPIFLEAFAAIPAISLAPTLTAYPAFLVAENIQPPYVAIDINPELTKAFQVLPLNQWPLNPVSGFNNLASYQLAQDTVNLTFYGLTNAQIQQVLAGLIDYSYGTDNFGFCNPPIIRDEQRMQVEIAALAMKKTLTLDVSYYQTTADAVARRLITSALITTTIQ